MTEPVAVVLAGGVSSRFWPLRDKLFLPFGTLTLFDRHLDTLRECGLERVVAVTRPDLVQAVTDSGRRCGVRLRVAVQPQARGMADALLCAAESIEAWGEDPSVYVTQAHDVAERRLHAELLARWSSEGGRLAGLIAAARVQTYFPGGYLELDGERVTAVIEKPGEGNEPSDLVNIVAHAHASWRALKQALEAESRLAGGDDVYERALTKLMQRGEYRPHVYDGRWQGLKYPWHALDVMDILLDLWTAGEETPGAGYEQREDGVFVAPEVRIFPGAHVVPPCLIGPAVVIGHNALVRGSVLGPGCVVGFGSEVARSLLVGDVELHHNYVGDSILDRGSSMGFGATTANYRIDGRTVPSMVGGQRLDTGRAKLGLVLGAGTKVGVNTSTMPGVKIGAVALIGPNLTVARDVPDGERVLDAEKYGRF